MRTQLKSLAILATATLATFGMAGTSSASEPSAKPGSLLTGHTVQVKLPMKVQGFDPAVAEAHGYKIVSLPDGQKTSVPKETSSASIANGTVSPDNQVNGNCGYSWLYMTADGGNYEASIDTGYNVGIPVTSHAWHISVSDGAGVSTLSDSGGLGGSINHIPFLIHGAGPGEGLAVVAPNSQVIRIDGEICHSAGPSDTAYFFKD